MKKGLFFVGAICIAISSAAIFTAFAEPTEQEKKDKAFNELKEKFMKEQMDICLKDADAKALEKYEAEEAEAKDEKSVNKPTGTTTKPATKPTTTTNQTTTTTPATTTPTTTPDPKKDKMTNTTTTTTQDKKDKMSGSSTTTNKKDKMSGGK